MQVKCPHCESMVEWAQGKGADKSGKVVCDKCRQSFNVRIKPPADRPPVQPVGAESFVWHVRKADGTLLSFPTDERFKEGIRRGLVDLDDEVSNDKTSWSRIRDLPLVGGFIERMIPTMGGLRAEPAAFSSTRDFERTAQGLFGAPSGDAGHGVRATDHATDDTVALEIGEELDPDLVESAKRVARNLMVEGFPGVPAHITNEHEPTDEDLVKNMGTFGPSPEESRVREPGVRPKTKSGSGQDLIDGEWFGDLALPGTPRGREGSDYIRMPAPRRWPWIVAVVVLALGVVFLLLKDRIVETGIAPEKAAESVQGDRPGAEEPTAKGQDAPGAEVKPAPAFEADSRSSAPTKEAPEAAEVKDKTAEPGQAGADKAAASSRTEDQAGVPAGDGGQDSKAPVPAPESVSTLGKEGPSVAPPASEGDNQAPVKPEEGGANPDTGKTPDPAVKDGTGEPASAPGGEGDSSAQPGTDSAAPGGDGKQEEPLVVRSGELPDSKEPAEDKAGAPDGQDSAESKSAPKEKAEPAKDDRQEKKKDKSSKERDREKARDDENSRQRKDKQDERAASTTAPDPDDLDDFDDMMKWGNKFRQSNPSKALKYFLAALNSRVRHPEASYKVGDCYYQMGRYGQAIPYFKTAIEVSHYHSAYTRIAQAYIKLGDKGAAVGYLKDGVKQFPNDYLLKSMLEQNQ